MTSLYIEHFGLSEAPFSITPNPHFFYAGSGRGSVLEALRYALQSEEGIVTVIGEVGSGKTMLCRMLLEQLPPQIDAIYLANPSFSRDEILDAIAHDLGVSPGAASAPTKLDALNRELIARYGAGRRVVLLVDEAHAMPSESLEEIRLLSNLETSRHKLLNIVLFGQPELAGLLARPSLRQLRERVVQRFELGPLPAGEVRDYLEFRLRAASHRGAFPFSRQAVARIGRVSGGLTRRINILADKALLSCFARNATRVETEDVRRAERDAGFAATRSASAPRWRMLAAATLAAIALGGAAFALGLQLGQRQSATGAAAPIPPPEPAAATVVAPVVAPDPNRADITEPPPPTDDAVAGDPAATTDAPIVATATDAGRSADAPPEPAATTAPPPIAGDRLAHAEHAFAQWLARTDEGFTLQIAALRRPDEATALRELTRIAAALPDMELRVQRRESDGVPILVFYAGDFASAAAARQAAAQLPDSLRNNQPIIRSLGAVRSGAGNRT
jgi:MSHA biogenesis protein MshM